MNPVSYVFYGRSGGQLHQTPASAPINLERYLSDRFRLPGCIWEPFESTSGSGYRLVLTEYQNVSETRERVTPFVKALLFDRSAGEQLLANPAKLAHICQSLNYVTEAASTADPDYAARLENQLAQDILAPAAPVRYKTSDRTTVKFLIAAMLTSVADKTVLYLPEAQSQLVLAAISFLPGPIRRMISFALPSNAAAGTEQMINFIPAAYQDQYSSFMNMDGRPLRTRRYCAARSDIPRDRHIEAAELLRIGETHMSAGTVSDTSEWFRDLEGPDLAGTLERLDTLHSLELLANRFVTNGRKLSDKDRNWLLKHSADVRRLEHLLSLPLPYELRQVIDPDLREQNPGRQHHGRRTHGIHNNENDYGYETGYRYKPHRRDTTMSTAWLVICILMGYIVFPAALSLQITAGQFPHISFTEAGISGHTVLAAMILGFAFCQFLHSLLDGGNDAHDYSATLPDDMSDDVSDYDPDERPGYSRFKSFFNRFRR